MKKTEVYVKIDTHKKAMKLKGVLDMFKESVPREINLGLSTGFYPDGDSQLEFPYLLIDEHKEWAAYCKRPKRKIKVSIKELRNILAKEHLKAGDVCLFDDRKGLKSIGVFDKYSEEYTDFLVSKVPGKDSVRYGFHDFIRYATEGEKALLEPKKELEVGKWYKTKSALFNHQNGYDSYGFFHNKWVPDDWKTNLDDFVGVTPVQATTQEVEQALIEEAKRRYKVGDVIKCFDDIELEVKGTDFLFCNNFLFSNGERVNGGNWFNTSGKLFEHGKWATIIEQGNFTDSDVAIVERLREVLLDNHGYSLESKLLTDARMLASKIKSNIK